MFTLHPTLLSDCFFIGRLSLCRILLMNNQAFPWLILVPERPDIKEIFELPSKDRKIVMEEISKVADILKQTYWADKINIAALGNQVEQLHIHIIARFKTDEAWPQPVWGKTSKPYTTEAIIEVTEKLRNSLKNLKNFSTVANQP